LSVPVRRLLAVDDDDDAGTFVVRDILFGNACIDEDDGDKQLKSLSCSTLITVVVVDTS
jgi:hypothetical protein